MPAGEKASTFFNLAAGEAGLKLVLIAEGNRQPTDLNVTDVMTALKSMKIAVEIDNDAVRRACKAASRGEHAEAVIAAGVPVVHGCDGKFLWAKKLVAPAEKGGRLSHYLGRVEKLIVKAGDALAKLVPEQQGSDGKDIYGKVLRANKGKPVKIHAGANVTEKDGVFYAAKDGIVRHDAGKISIDEVFPVDGNLGFEVGNIDFTGAVIIHGGVLDLFEVKAGGAVSIDGLIEAANITSGADMDASGGIAGKKKGVIRCGGNLTAKFLVNAEVYAAHDVHVETQIISSKVMALGAVLAPAGAIAGGEIFALAGVDADTIGSESAARTEVTAGLNYDFARLVVEADEAIAEARMRITTVDKEIGILSAKPPSNDLRERITVLQTDKSDAEQAVSNAEKMKNDAITMTRERARPVVIVRKMVYPGVVVRLADCKTTISEQVKGPMKMIVDRKSGVIRFVPIS